MFFSNRILICVCCISLLCCKEPKQPKPSSREAIRALQNVIPKPDSVVSTGNTFILTNETKIWIDPDFDELNFIGHFLSGKLKPSTGFDISVSKTDKAPEQGIFLTLSKANSGLGAEGYQLSIKEELITLSALTPAGIFRGVQTLRQLFPAAIESDSLQQGAWEIATAEITDSPKYEWRGSMLDVARHFFSVKDVKRYIDLIALYKMNVLHLHLSDDQGWRVEIKSWPNLTLIGGTKQVGGGKGGFYTQEEYKEIIKYASDRYITVVPEIDLPGHINAALASYPELNCNGKATKLYTGTNVGFSTLCVNEITFKFVDDVVRELADMTPTPYIHIGGDEAAATKKSEYIKFINKFSEIVKSHGKKMVGWEEIGQANIDSNSIAQYWSSQKHAKTAVDKGAKIILSPSKKVYLDMKYDTATKLGLHWAAYIDVDSSYDWNPSTILPGLNEQQILGVESPLWSETISTMDDIEFLMFPRLPGVAEIGWTKKRNWDDYKMRLGIHGPRLKAMDVNFYPSKKIQWAKD
jgi:hexosaminidase